MSYIFTETSPNLDRNSKLLLTTSKNSKGFAANARSLDNSAKELLINDIREFYFNRKWGLKLLARNVLGISYSNCRFLFGFLGIEFRKGYNVVTDSLKTFRKEKAQYENESGTAWRNPTLKRFAKRTTRGVQGYYLNLSTNSYVWLRSSWEYVFAKFLNKIQANWKIEERYYTLSNKCKYSPDFYVYDSEWKLIQIIEIKGYFDCNAYKLNLLRDDLFNDSAVELILISNITNYLEKNTTYNKELQEWKMLRKSKEFVSNR